MNSQNTAQTGRIETGTEAIVAQNLKKTFTQGGNDLKILDNLTMSIERGEMVGLVGPSGSGKSTLLQILGLLDRPDSGDIHILGEGVKLSDESMCTILRRKTLGFVYQFHHLQPEFSALENIMLPQLAAGKRKKESESRALKILAQMKLEDRAHHRPAQLSGGEQQRVAIGRALANDPQIVLADEPTGNLDPKTADVVFETLLSLVQSRGISMVIATHNFALADQMSRTLELRRGKLYTY